MAKNITHTSPAVPTTSSFWLLPSHANSTRYQNLNKANENHHCYMKNASAIGSDTRIWVKSAGGGYAKSVTEILNGFDKNTKFSVNDGVSTNHLCKNLGSITISDTGSAFTGSFASASHGDLFTIYNVGDDFNSNPGRLTSSRFVFVNGVLTKRDYSFDVNATSASCIAGSFPTLDMPSDQILFKRDTYGAEPVRAIMYLSHSRICLDENCNQVTTAESQYSTSINYCINNNYGWYYGAGSTPGNPAPSVNWQTAAGPEMDITKGLVKAINHYSPWYSAAFAATGSIKFTARIKETPGLIDNIGKVYLINRKLKANTTASCFCCDNQGYQIEQISLPSADGMQASEYAYPVKYMVYWYDWNHYNKIWNGTQINDNGIYDVPTTEVASYGSSIKEVDVGDCGCSQTLSATSSAAFGSSMLTVHGEVGSITASVTELAGASSLDSYMMSKDKQGLTTKRPDCECNEIKGWKNTSLDSCGPIVGGTAYQLEFSDGYTFVAGAYARLITHNTTQRNNMSGSNSGSISAKWPYDIRIPTVIEMYNNRAYYATSSHEVGFIKCADIYPGNTQTTGNVFLTNIYEYTASRTASVDVKGQRFLSALGDSEFTFVDQNNDEKNTNVAKSYQKHTHMTTFNTGYPRTHHPQSIFSGCVMIENGLYVLFEDFCYTGSGCMEPKSSNYDWKAVTDDDSCKYQFGSSYVSNKIKGGRFHVIPATWSTGEIDSELAIYNYDTSYDIHVQGTDAFGESQPQQYNGQPPGLKRFSEANKSIFTTDGYNTPIFGYNMSGVGQKRCSESVAISGSYLTSSTGHNRYHYRLVNNRLSNSSPHKYSASLYGTFGIAETAGYGPIGWTTITGSYPFTSAPTMTTLTTSYTGTSELNVSIDATGSATASGLHTYKTSALANVSYLDVSERVPPHLGALNNLGDLNGTAFPNLRYLSCTVGPAGPTSLDFTTLKQLQHLHIEPCRNLEELDISTNRNLRTIKLIDSCSIGGSLSKFHIKSACKIESIRLENCFTTSSSAAFDMELYGAGELRDLTVIGGSLTTLDLSRNNKLQNVIITENNIRQLDVSCAGFNLRSLFLASTQIVSMSLYKNTALQALSLANTLVTAPVNLSGQEDTVKSLSYKNCNITSFGQGYSCPINLIDLELTGNPNITSISIADRGRFVKNLFAGDCPSLTSFTYPNQVYNNLRNVALYNTNNPLRATSGWVGQDKIEVLNMQNAQMTKSIAWPSESKWINVSDNKMTADGSLNFRSCSKLEHIEIERCLVDNLQLVAASPGGGFTSSLKHILAAENALNAFATASVIDNSGSTIVAQYVVQAGADTIYNLNRDLGFCGGVQILDVSDQVSTNADPFVYLDLREQKDLRVLDASGNIHLKAIRFDSHSLQKLGATDVSQFGNGAAARSMTIDVSDCDQFTHFIVSHEKESQSIDLLQAQGFINPHSDDGQNWKICIMPE